MMSNCHSHAGHDGADNDGQKPDGKDDVDGAIDMMDVAEDSQLQIKECVRSKGIEISFVASVRT
jgi:hypothetical protein